MLGYLAAHEEWFSPDHEYTAFHGVLALPHRAAAFAGPELVRGYYDDDAEAVFRPIRLFLKRRGIEATFVHKMGDPAEN